MSKEVEAVHVVFSRNRPHNLGNRSIHSKHRFYNPCLLELVPGHTKFSDISLFKHQDNSSILTEPL